MNIKKAMEIFAEKDPDKRKALIDALPENEKESCIKELEKLAKSAERLHNGD